MENKLSSILVILLISLIALTTYWLKLEVIKELYSEKSLLASGPDFYLNEFSTKQTTETGNIKFILSGKKMTNYEHINKTYLKNPKFTKLSSLIHEIILAALLSFFLVVNTYKFNFFILL